MKPKSPEISIWKRLERIISTGIFGTTFEGSPVLPIRSVRPKSPFPFDKIIIPSTAHLYPAYKHDNQTRGGL